MSKPTVVPAVYIVGPSATGKTTLCNALARRLNIQPPAYITEVARRVMQETGFSRADVGKLEMQTAIMTAQLQAEWRARESVQRQDFRIVLSDRSAVDAIVYAMISSSPGFEKLIESDEFQRTLSLYQKSTFVLLTPVPGWLQDDGVRSMGDHGIGGFRQVLKRLEIPFQEIDGSCRLLEERVARVIGWVGL
ncbi:hypothetical protein BD410DRAFT_900932 [Rickenella mellea]|uniref:NadR/Ttd14 AAA domain-containing protein n=1 Tax=Rickenella mellea TaxID=50990 RepID=A0A4Y7PSA1_9AGAM|nr:hypothetical protein BD410DRAFT_900932 [Rickenella mellea]